MVSDRFCPQIKTMNNIIELTEDNFDMDVAQANLPVIVDFHAPWCGPCKTIAPLVKQLATEYAGRLKFAKADVDQTPDLAGKFQIAGVPTLMLFRDGKPVDKIVGFPGQQALRFWLERVAGTGIAVE